MVYNELTKSFQQVALEFPSNIFRVVICKQKNLLRNLTKGWGAEYRLFIENWALCVVDSNCILPPMLL